MAKKLIAKAENPRRRKPQWATVAAISDPKPEVLSERYHSRTIERALDALEAFDSGTTSLSLKDLSSVIDQPESSLYRVLTTLQKRDYLLQNRDGTYQLTRKVLHGRLYERAELLKVTARPFIEELSRQFDETVSLSYLFTDYVQVLDTIEAFHPIRVTNRAGRIIPPHCSSMGKAIMAYQSSEVADRMLETYGLVRRTEHSISDRQTLRMELETSRKSGFAVDRQESMLGGICYGAPIFLSPVSVVGAISVSTPIQRLNKDREQQIRDSVVAAAVSISKVFATALRSS
jgi:IclR family acetate operon transcriptional repressor